MGMRITGAILKKEIAHDTDALEKAFDIKITGSEKDTWNEFEGGFDKPGKLVVYQKGGSTIIYFPLEWVYEKGSEIQRLLGTVPEGVQFAMDETSMTFYFKFFKEGERPAESVYLFRDDLLIKGENRLELTDENDMIWDGLFPIFQEYTGGTDYEDAVTIYSFSESGEDPSEPAEDVKESVKIDSPEFTELMNSANKIITTRPVKDGYKALRQLQQLFTEYASGSGSFPEQIVEDHKQYCIQEEHLTDQIMMQAHAWQTKSYPANQGAYNIFHFGLQLSESSVNLEEKQREINEL